MNNSDQDDEDILSTIGYEVVLAAKDLERANKFSPSGISITVVLKDKQFDVKLVVSLVPKYGDLI